MTNEDKPGWGDNIERLVVIVFLGLTVIGSVAAAVILTSRNEEVPDMIQLIAATAVGGLAGMLTGGN